jgi:hypothetical protein
VNKNRLHAAAICDVGTWHSLPPHVPGACFGADGEPCPEGPYEPCQHNHQSSRAALACSRNRPPFQATTATT